MSAHSIQSQSAPGTHIFGGLPRTLVVTSRTIRALSCREKNGARTQCEFIPILWSNMGTVATGLCTDLG